ncbi:unnamed protein product [Nezara viridula]|uniref:Uncharacterized protein n=1 Tax=Nezara viridula TaxID=85310 RepID=A0A9P0HCN2_NEZVI|nr:unnamed protein product [Nezara viridula]
MFKVCGYFGPSFRASSELRKKYTTIIEMTSCTPKTTDGPAHCPLPVVNGCRYLLRGAVAGKSRVERVAVSFPASRRL